MDKRVIVLHSQDNVATAIADLDPGETINVPGGGSCLTAEAIPFGHKVALQSIPQGQAVMKYGENIGLALKDIAEGACVHVHNIDSQRGRGDR